MYLSLFLAVAVSGISSPSTRDDRPPSAVAPRQFHWQALREPEPLFWPAYFWLWNGPLEPETLRRQLRDMRSHEARSVCVLPMPRDFRPESTANLMDVDYLSPAFFSRVQTAVDEASRLGMNYWLYDEGGWPSGQATGRVVAARPDLAAQVLRPDAAGRWSLGKHAWRPDVLNPETTSTFLSLTHERYLQAVGSHFGKSIRLAFTDEPAFPRVVAGREVPWTANATELFRRQFGYELEPRLSAFRDVPASQLSSREKQARIDAFDFWSSRFREGYFQPLRRWTRQHDLAQGGHLGGEDETLGAARYGFGQVMRQLRMMDVPGVDIIWRQVFPGKRNHHFPKFASSAAHQNGTALGLTESFCVYGNGLTPAQMRWLIDYQYVRGLNVLVAGCYPLSTRDHLMPGERPHFGPVDPLWDFLPAFHRSVARLGYVLACGEPVIETALYYPVRDIWASGADSPATAGHDELARLLLERQCDFDVIDDDLLSDPATRAEKGTLLAGKMRYKTVVVGPNEWIAPRSEDALRTFERAGGRVVRINRIDDAPGVLNAVEPTVELSPPSPSVRVAVRRWPGGGAAFVFNEGETAYEGRGKFPVAGPPLEIDLDAGTAHALPGADSAGSTTAAPISLAGGESMLIVLGRHDGATVAPRRRRAVEAVPIDDGWEARPLKRHVVREHDYDIRSLETDRFERLGLGSWNSLVGDDFSGRVVYRRVVKVPSGWNTRLLGIDLGRVDFAARVRIGGKDAGIVLPPQRTVALPEPSGAGEFLLEVEVANTLANELTSSRVRESWSKRTGPGWPGPYHTRALQFEEKSRGGGLFGPVRLVQFANE